MKSLDTVDKIFIGTLTIFGLVTIDSIVANICRYKAYKAKAETFKELEIAEDSNDSDSIKSLVEESV